MNRHGFLFLLLCVSFISACKKDLISFNKVHKLDTHTNDDRLEKIFFFDKKTGFIVGGQRFYNAVILTTDDGGYTWQKKTYPEAGKSLHDIVLSPSGALYICGFDGKLLRSYDTGKTWLFSQLEYFAYTGIAFTDAAHALVVGGVSGNSGIVQYIDSTGGFTRRDSFHYQFNKIFINPDKSGYICGYGLIKKTTDGGATWNFLNVKYDNFTNMDIHGNEIWACGYNGSVVHTTNAGGNWQTLRNGNDITIPRYHLYCILFKDKMNGWAAGEQGKVIYTRDGGKNWSEYDHFTNSTLRSIALCPNGDLLIAGDNGVLFRMTP